MLLRAAARWARAEAAMRGTASAAAAVLATDGTGVVGGSRPSPAGRAAGGRGASSSEAAGSCPATTMAGGRGAGRGEAAGSCPATTAAAGGLADSAPLGVRVAAKAARPAGTEAAHE